MQKMLTRGFTLIELLVVIAIIGILAAVVLGSLNDARDNANDASAQTSVNNVRNVAEVFYSENGFSYGDTDTTNDFDGTALTPVTTGATMSVCNDGGIIGLMEAASGQTRNDVTCVADDSAYALEIPLRSGSFYCIDSTGFAGQTDVTSGLVDGPAGNSCDS